MDNSKRPDVFVTGAAVAIIVFAIVITAVVQGPPPKTFSQVITVGPIWRGDSKPKLGTTAKVSRRGNL